MQLRENLRNLLIAAASVADLGHETDAFSAANTREYIPLPSDETTYKFLDKATETVTNWIADLQLKKAEILKDCPSWFPNCRNLEVLYKLLVNNGTTIEPMYAQRDGQDTWLNGADSLKLPCLMFIMGYQFSFSIHLLEDVASMAQPCVHRLILSGKNNSLGATLGSYLVMNSPEANPTMGSMFSPDSVHVVNLANWIGQRLLEVIVRRVDKRDGSVECVALASSISPSSKFC